MHKKRLFFVINTLEIGGAEKAMLKLINAISIDYKVSLLILLPSGNPSFLLSLRNVEILQLDVRKSFFGSLWKIFRYFRSSDPDVVHTWLALSNLIGGVIARLTGCKNIFWSVRSSEPWQKGTSFYTNLSVYLSIPFSYFVPDKILYVSEFGRLKYSNIFYDMRKSHVIHNGFNLPQIQISDDDLNDVYRDKMLSSSSVVIGSVGRYHVVKDHANFIKACLVVIENLSDLDIHVFLIGRGVNNEAIRNLIKESRVAQNFHLLEETIDIGRYYSVFDLFCLHSLNEGFPNVLAEAMSYSCACISTDVGDARLILCDDDLIFEKGNIESLANMITKFLNFSSETKQRIKVSNRHRIEAHFSFDLMVNKHKELYETIK